MTFRLRTPLLLVCQLVLLYACVESYDVKFNLDAELVTVDGFITDLGGDVITISISRSKNGDSYAIPLTKCRGELLVGDGTSIPLSEISEGQYSPPVTFKGIVGQTYQLRFTTPKGDTYESSVEELRSTPSIDKFYESFNLNGLVDKTGTKVLGSTLDIFVDFKDSPLPNDHYLWRWKLFENQFICKTCNGGRLVGGTCSIDRSPTPTTYDYPCSSTCWEIFYNEQTNILSDEFINGKSVQGRLVAQIPFYSSTGALLEVEQVALTQSAFEYFTLLNQQTQTNGTLIDTPPAPIIGNIRNSKNENEKVVGYFGAGGSRKVRYWLDRTKYTSAKLTSLLGRSMLLEPTSPSPTFPCEASRTRTPIRPDGWQ